MTTERRATIEEMYDPAIGCVVANETAPHRCLQHQPEPNHRNCLGVEMAGNQSTQNLQSRVNLALSILDHREYSPANWNAALAALKGASIEDLMDRDDESTDLIPQYSPYDMESEGQRSFSLGWDRGYARGLAESVRADGS